MSYKCGAEGITSSVNWLTMIIQPMIQQDSIVARDNETRDNDSSETELFTASVVVMSGKNLNFTTHHVPKYY